jgi:hypothetical protein
MNPPLSVVRLAPITSGLIERNPKILLGGDHQPTLLRYLDGWPRRWGKPRTFLIQFAHQPEALAAFAADQFDFAVIQTPGRDGFDEALGHLVRVARQGLITRR